MNFKYSMRVYSKYIYNILLYKKQLNYLQKMKSWCIQNKFYLLTLYYLITLYYTKFSQHFRYWFVTGKLTEDASHSKCINLLLSQLHHGIWKQILAFDMGIRLSDSFDYTPVLAHSNNSSLVQ